MVRAYIGVGSNIDPFDSVARGLAAISKVLNVSAVSKFYLNSAVGTSEGQHEFLNGVIAIETELDPYELKFKVLRSIEKDFGRQEGEHKHDERRLDLDVILYGGLVLETELMQVPHPETLTRDFVYVPLLELVPGMVHPGEGLPVCDLIEGEPRSMKAYSFSNKY